MKSQAAHNKMWILFAVLSALFAALASIFAKVGIVGVDSNLATAIRTVVVVGLAWGIVFITGAQNGIAAIDKTCWVFLILSGIATGASWLFYYRALSVGEVAKVAPIDKFSVVITVVLAVIFLHEKLDLKSGIGVALITAGTVLMAL